MSYNDTIYIKSSHESSEIAENFCQQIFDDYEIEVREGISMTSTSPMDGNVSYFRFRTHIASVEPDIILESRWRMMFTETYANFHVPRSYRT